MNKRKAFTMIELMVVVALIALLMAILTPSLSLVHERAKRTVCASNLHGLSQALYLYAQNPPFLFPALAAAGYQNDGALHLFYPDDRTTAPSTTGIPSPTVDLWMVVQRSYTVPKQLTCPSTLDVPDPATDATAYFDFLGLANLSYGYQYQHDANAPTLGINAEPTFPVMADANPYIKGGIPGSTFATDRTSTGLGNSVNHRNREGQNVLYQAGHVVFESGPDVGLAGKATSGLTISRGRDHCYTTHAGTADATVDYGAAAPTWTAPAATGTCNLGSKSDACLVP